MIKKKNDNNNNIKELENESLKNGKIFNSFITIEDIKNNKIVEKPEIPDVNLNILNLKDNDYQVFY